MIIGACTLTLHLPMVGSLKEKRQIIKSLLARVRNEFNVSIAEVDAQDTWQVAVIGLACVSASERYARGQIDAVLRFIEAQRPDVPLVNYDIELL
jgi:hypothetical protein